MPKLDVAKVKLDCNDVILIALDAQFEQLTEDEKQDARADYKMRCRLAGLRGSVALFWEASGRTGFIGPPNWHRYLEHIDLRYIKANLNQTISW